MDAAMQPPEPLGRDVFFGEITTLDVWFCVLQKGVGKIPFNPIQHAPEQRRTAIKIGITPLRGQYDITQDCIDTSKEWRLTLPSLNKLNLHLSTLKGRFVQIKRVQTGDTYTNGQGQLKYKTAIVIEAIYPDKNAAQSAADAFYNARKPALDAELPNDLGQQPTPTPTSAPTPVSVDISSAEREFAYKVLPALWGQAGGDWNKLNKLVQDNTLVSKYVSPDDLVKWVSEHHGQDFPF